MMRSKWVISVLVAAALGAGAWFMLRREAAPGVSKAPIATPSITVPPEVEAFKKAPPVTRVQDFYESESKRIGAVDPNPKLTQARLELVAAELSPEEVKWLAGTALNAKENGDGRFFATYLLALGRSAEGTAALRQIALTEIPKRKNQGLEELERQIRAQATEGLGHSCDVAGARDALLDIVEMQLDEFIRDRAHRALYQCRTGQPVEAQDKEALDKLLYKK
jgi:hypothetical protein